MRLTEFVTRETDRIADEWTRFARTLQPTAAAMTAEDLRDSLPTLLAAIVRQMEVRLSDVEVGAARDDPGGQGHEVNEPSGVHALSRFEVGFDLQQVISEYRALRLSVLRLWAEQPDPEGADKAGVWAFNEAIDEALAEAAARYTEKIHELKDLFLGVMGHDLRNPLSAIIMSANALAKSPSIDEQGRRRLRRMVGSAERMQRMIVDVLDLTRRRFGRALPIHPEPTDFGALCREIADEMRASHPLCDVRIEERGDLRGEWDRGRIIEVISNLLTNSAQHGAEGAPVAVLVVGEEHHVILSVTNQGTPIPEADLAELFEPFHTAGNRADESGNLGLGLFIAREVVQAHGGSITASSSEEQGTTFTVRLPRRPG